jgi:predicted nucleic-acid-binding Zn-ribbon protein
MKVSRQCPKCHSRKVIEVVGHNYNQNQTIPLHKWNMKHAILDRYICADCGYTEEYVQLTSTFRKWADKTWAESDGRFDEYV